MGWIREGIHRKIKIISNILFLGFVDIYNSIRYYNLHVYSLYFVCISNIMMKLICNF